MDRNELASAIIDLVNDSGLPDDESMLALEHAASAYRVAWTQATLDAIKKMAETLGGGIPPS